MKRINLFGLSILSGLILGVFWSLSYFSILLLFAFIPLLIAENYVYNNKSKYSNVFVFHLAFVGFFIWNAITTYWIYNSSIFGAVAATLFNSLFQSIVFLLYHITKCKMGFRKGNYAFIAYWIAFEFFHLDWDLSWSWLTLGNGFSDAIALVQWYEYTGVFGGSLWILAANIVFFNWINIKYIERKENGLFFLIFGCLLFILPTISSILLYTNYSEKKDSIDVVVVQPNIDPYNEKFSGMTSENQLVKMLRLAKQKIDSNTQFVVFPETAIPEGIWEEEIEEYRTIDSLRVLLNNYPKLTVIIGASTHKIISDLDNLPISARKFSDDDSYYEAFNTSILLEKNFPVQFYHKSKLVAGVEQMPFANYLKFLNKLALDMGGTTGTLGTQPNRTPLYSETTNIKIAPVICYESIFGEFVGKFVSNGAQFIAIQTNDGWWGDTPGYKQHCRIASLRAIETRRSIARSANTGTSCFINQKGEIQNATKWWKEDAIKSRLNLNDKITFYVKFGDYIGRFMSIIAILLLLLTAAKIAMKQKYESLK